MEHRFLYIYPKLNPAFVEVLANVLASYGKLEVISWSELNALDLNGFSLVFLDALILADPQGNDSLGQIVTYICQRWPQVKLVVVTASPTWRRAVEALQAGAVDYIRQSMDENHLRREMESSISYYILA